MKKANLEQAEYAVSVRGLSKRFVIPHERVTTLKGAFVGMFRRKTFEEFSALRGVSFDVRKGECFGIVGRNGSGKSTLLKILAGVYSADEGVLRVNGRISPFLELGIGFNPELSGRDNIYLNATVLGLSKDAIDRKFDSIVEFSEVGRFIDQKLKNYSSGMQVRLAFSVAVHANREVLLMDEVLAVGDANFQRKCIAEFERYQKEGKTVILVTHDVQMIQKYCDRAMLLESGNMVMVGHPDEVLLKYQGVSVAAQEAVQEAAEEKAEEASEEADRGALNGSPRENAWQKLESVSCSLYDEKGNETFALQTGRPFRAVVRATFSERSENVALGVMFRNGMGDDAFGLHSLHSRHPMPIPLVEKGQVLEVALDAEMLLTQGTYSLYVGIADNEKYPNYDLLYSSEQDRRVDVVGTGRYWGPLNADHSASIINPTDAPA